MSANGKSCSAYLDLEPLICDTRNAVDIFAHLYEALIEALPNEVLHGQDPPLSTREREMLGFALGEAERRAAIVHQAFYDGWERATGAPQPVAEAA